MAQRECRTEKRACYKNSHNGGVILDERETCEAGYNDLICGGGICRHKISVV